MDKYSTKVFEYIINYWFTSWTIQITPELLLSVILEGCVDNTPCNILWIFCEAHKMIVAFFHVKMEQRAQPPCSPACDHHPVLSPPAERLQGEALRVAGPWPYICALEISEFILPQGILTSLLIF